ncbi:hypothetical protein E2320_007191, partial [Naja naja]
MEKKPVPGPQLALQTSDCSPVIHRLQKEGRDKEMGKGKGGGKERQRVEGRKEGRKERGRKEDKDGERKEGGKEGRKEGRLMRSINVLMISFYDQFQTLPGSSDIDQTPDSQKEAGGHPNPAGLQVQSFNLRPAPLTHSFPSLEGLVVSFLLLKVLFQLARMETNLSLLGMWFTHTHTHMVFRLLRHLLGGLCHAKAFQPSWTLASRQVGFRKAGRWSRVGVAWACPEEILSLDKSPPLPAICCLGTVPVFCGQQLPAGHTNTQPHRLVAKALASSLCGRGKAIA